MLWVIAILANLPLPVVMFLNYRVTLKFWRVHQLSKHKSVKKPPRLILGWCLSNVAAVFVVIPVVAERKLLVEDPRWLVSYALAATLTISGLLLMDSALGTELKQLARRRRLKSAH